jgi:hypothetical protein
MTGTAETKLSESDAGKAEELYDLAVTLERFNVLTEQITLAVGRDDYERGIKLLSERRVVVQALREHDSVGTSPHSTVPESRGTYQAMKTEIKKKNDEVLSLITEKRSALIRKLIDLQKFKSYQAYISQE